MRNLLAVSFLSLAMCFVGACSDRPHLAFGNVVTVRVISDYAPGIEVVRAETTLSRGERTATSARVQAFDASLTSADDLLAGHVIAESTALEDGTYTVKVSLRDRTGAVTGERVQTFDVSGDTTVTVHITAACRDVVCTEGACFGGRCVDARCSPDSPEHCPPKAVCGTDGDCEGESTCAMAACLEGACGFRPEAGECGADEYCAREEGCAPVDMPTMPGGPDSRCGRVCALDGDVCRYGYYACTAREDGSTDVVCTSFVARPVGSPCGVGLVCDEAALCVEGEAMDGGFDGGPVEGTDGGVDGAIVLPSDMGSPDMCSRFITVPRDPTCNPDVNACAVVTVCADTYDAGVLDAAADSSAADMTLDSGPVDPPICATPLYVTDAASIEPYLPCRSIPAIYYNPDTSTAPEIVLPNLERLPGGSTLWGDSNNLLRVSMPALVESGGLYIYYHGALREIDLRSLRTAFHLGFYSIPAVEHLDLRALESVTAMLHIQEAIIESLDLGALESVGSYLTLQNLPRVASVDLGALSSVGGDVMVRSNPYLCDFIPESQIAPYDGVFMFEPGAMCADYCDRDLVVVTQEDVDDHQHCAFLRSLTIRNTSLASVAFPNLVRVGGTVESRENASLIELSLPKLVEVGGQLFVYDENTLETLDVSRLVRVDALSLYDADALEQLPLPRLVSASSFVSVFSCDLLGELTLPSLSSIGSMLEVGSNAALASFSAPRLEFVASAPPEGSVFVRSNPSLAEVDLASLRYVGSVTVNTNPLLCDFPPLTQLSPAPASYDVMLGDLCAPP